VAALIRELTGNLSRRAANSIQRLLLVVTRPKAGGPIRPNGWGIFLGHVPSLVPEVFRKNPGLTRNQRNFTLFKMSVRVRYGYAAARLEMAIVPRIAHT
jgi:hypothetical protein